MKNVNKKSLKMKKFVFRFGMISEAKTGQIRFLLNQITLGLCLIKCKSLNPFGFTIRKT